MLFEKFNISGTKFLLVADHARLPIFCSIAFAPNSGRLLFYEDKRLCEENGKKILYLTFTRRQTDFVEFRGGATEPHFVTYACF